MHNKRKEVAQFFDLLVETLHDLSLKLDANTYWTKLFPDRPFSDLAWRRLRHRLLAALEDNLVHDHRQIRTAESQRHLIEAYEDAGLYAHLRTRLNRYKTDHSASLDRYHYDYRHEQLRYKIDLATDTRSKRFKLEEQENQLERYMLALSLRQACATLAHQRIHKLDFELPFLDLTLARASAPKYVHEPGIRLFYLGTQLYLQKGEAANRAFRELRAGLTSHGKHFTQIDRQSLLLLAINHSLRESNAGQPGFLKDTLALYRYGLETNTLLEGRRLGQRTFNNIVGVATRLNELEWTSDFIDRYESKLHPKWRQEISSLARARISWARRDYDATIKYLQTADYQDPYHQLTARVFQLKVYFAQDAYNLIEAHLRTTRSYIRRRKLGYHRQNYHNIFRLASQVARLSPGMSKTKDRLRREIENCEPCTEKKWLLSLL